MRPSPVAATAAAVVGLEVVPSSVVAEIAAAVSAFAAAAFVGIELAFDAMFVPYLPSTFLLPQSPPVVERQAVYPREDGLRFFFLTFLLVFLSFRLLLFSFHSQDHDAHFTSTTSLLATVALSTTFNLLSIILTLTLSPSLLFLIPSINLSSKSYPDSEQGRPLFEAPSACSCPYEQATWLHFEHALSGAGEELLFGEGVRDRKVEKVSDVNWE